MNASFSSHLQKGARCKNKWGAFVGNFKKIYDYKIGTKNNQEY
jgi:hypothetical protein